MNKLINKINSCSYEKNQDTLSFIDKCLIFFYLFLSCFETYIPGHLASITKFVMLGIVFSFFIKELFRKGLTIKWPSILMITWLFIKIISIFWGGFNNIVEIHFLSQFGFVLLFVTFASKDYSQDDATFLVKSMFYTTLIFCIMSLIFQEPYRTTYISRRVLTLFGKQLDPNNCAAFECITLAISLYYISKKKYLYLVPAFIASIAILLSGSRAGLICAVLLFIIAVFTFPIKLKGSIFIKIFLIIILCGLAIMIAYLILPSETFNRLFIIDYVDTGGGERDIYWSLAFDMFREKPVFGWGWGTASYFGKVSSAAVHNTYLSMMAENGVVSLILFLIFPCYCTCVSIRKKKYFNLFLFVAMFIPTFFIDSINKRFIWNVLYLMLFVYKFDVEEKKLSYEKEFYRISI